MIENIAAYRFVPIHDADALARRLGARAAELELLGTLIVAPEGINLFLAGTRGAIDAFVDALRADARLAAIVVKRSRSATTPFARLKVKRKCEIITFRRGEVSPLTRRAPALSPQRFAAWLERGVDEDGRRVVLLDTRNREEVEHGSFAGACTLPITAFTEFPAAVEACRTELADAAIVSFCTGGVRCEKAALWMQDHGFANVWQLDGGILGYFEQVGGFGYEGSCFVFDERVALDSTLAALGEREPSDFTAHPYEESP
ncbi:MAG: sulfurtransferase [Xanthomonadales bacterium]|nr:sulfurtransferase [Xanthomonadales bacterium]